MGEEALLANTRVGMELDPEVGSGTGEVVGRQVAAEPAEEGRGWEVSVSNLG